MCTDMTLLYSLYNWIPTDPDTETDTDRQPYRSKTVVRQRGLGERRGKEEGPDKGVLLTQTPREKFEQTRGVSVSPTV